MEQFLSALGLPYKVSQVRKFWWHKRYEIAIAALLFSVVIVYSVQHHGGWWLWGTLVLFAPAFFANMAPPAVGDLIKDQPDVVCAWLREPLSASWLGENKSRQGFITATLVGGATGLASFQLGEYVPFFKQSLIPIVDTGTAMLLGTLMGLGAIVGDAVESAIKRWFGIKPGVLWYPFDYWDFIVGAWLMLTGLVVAGAVQGADFQASTEMLLWLLAFCGSVLPLTSEFFCLIGRKKRGEISS